MGKVYTEFGVRIRQERKGGKGIGDRGEGIRGKG
jgi:hypothetical protein